MKKTILLLISIFFAFSIFAQSFAPDSVRVRYDAQNRVEKIIAYGNKGFVKKDFYYQTIYAKKIFYRKTPLCAR